MSMAGERERIRASNGLEVEIVADIAASGAMKDVYFTSDRSHVAAFFRKQPDFNARERLENITGVYRERIFNDKAGPYWSKYFCWPVALLEWRGKTGVLCPTYAPNFYFQDGPFKGKEKEGKWFTSAKLLNRFLPAMEKGTWLSQLRVCLSVARAVRRLHAAGLAHSDLSYKNVLIDPQAGLACIIDIDGLVVPGKFPPDVVGTPDFIAPEVMATRHLDLFDPARKLPRISTDKHALAVLIYMNLLHRHPLRGSLVHNLDPAIDEELSMGSKALFIEHPTDDSNRPKREQLEPSELPQRDIEARPYSICGPYLKNLFDRAFVDGLHNPDLRPTAADWETAILKTLDLLQPCPNSGCEGHWFAFDNSKRPVCPFCRTPFKGVLPILNLYYSPKNGVFKPEDHRLMVYDKQSLYAWHCDRFITPNEKLDAEDKKPVGDFHFHKGSWILINRRLPHLYDKTEDKKIEIGQAVELSENRRILLGAPPGGRLAMVQIVKV